MAHLARFAGKSVQERAILTACALAACVVATGAAGSAATPTAAAPVARVLVGARGLYLVSSTGSVQKLLDARWSPLAAASVRGPFVARLVGADPPRLWIVSGSGSVELPNTGPARCVAISPGGRYLSYVFGTQQVQIGQLANGAPAYGTRGSVYLVDLTRAPKAVPVMEATFPNAECPRWSPDGARLAMVAGGPPWRVAVWSSAGIVIAGLVRDAVPSVQYSTFAWGDADTLSFFGSEGVFEWSASTGERARLVVPPSALSSIGSGGTQYPFSLWTSPNGRLLGVSTSKGSAVFARDARRVGSFRGKINGWAGNSGVLTLEVDRQFVVVLRRYSLTGRRRMALVARGFKYGVVTDPAGRWFAHPGARGVSFRRADASLRKRVALGFRPTLVAGVGADGRIVLPVSVY